VFIAEQMNTTGGYQPMSSANEIAPSASNLTPCGGEELTVLNTEWLSTPSAYYLEQQGTISRAHTNLTAFAADAGADLDAVSITEAAAFGFQLGNRTLFDGVKSLLPAQEMLRENGRTIVREMPLVAPGEPITEFLSARVTEAFEEGAAMELTGGLDSRLLLACGMAKGVKPKVSFTLGNETDSDVQRASQIAQHYDFPHQRIPTVVNESRLKQDAFDVVRFANYSINAAAYAWLPGTLEPLDEVRSAQITGTSGEIAGSSYYTPLDHLVDPLGLQRAWVRHRLVQPWIPWQLLWEQNVVRDIETKMLDETVAALNEPPGGWRERTDDFYRDHKTRRWWIPVFDMSNHYYRVIAPFITHEYIGWCDTIPLEQRPGRGAQLDLLRKAFPELAVESPRSDIPSIEFKHEAVPLFGKSLSVAKTIVKRLSKAKRGSAMGTTESAAKLGRDADMRGLIETMVSESRLPFHQSNIAQLLNEPAEHPDLFGVLLTAAIAWQDLTTAKRAHQEANPAVAQ